MVALLRASPLLRCALTILISCHLALTRRGLIRRRTLGSNGNKLIAVLDSIDLNTECDLGLVDVASSLGTVNDSLRDALRLP